MKVSFNTNIRTDDWPKAGEDFTQRFISNYSQMVTQLGQALAQGLTFADNMNACWLTASCTHATAVGIANPLQNKSAPKQVLVFPGTQPIRSYSWTYAASTNQISLTVNYDVTTMTDWVSYTPTGSWTTNTTYTGEWRQVGDTMEVQVGIALAGAPNTASLAQVLIPTGYTIDTTKIPNFAASANVLGVGNMKSAGTSSYLLTILYTTTTAVRPVYQNNPSGTIITDAGITQAAPGTFANADRLDMMFRVPIVGWSASTSTTNDSPTILVIGG